MADAQTERIEAVGEDVYCQDGKYEYIYSADRKYRYWLGARLCEVPKKEGAILFIMLNPGTEKGKEERSNHTTRKNCERFVGEQGYGRLWTCNLFAYRASDSSKIRNESHIGENNDSYILECASQAAMIVCAWGEGRSQSRRFRNHRGDEIIRTLKGNGLLSKAYYLGLTKANQPRHPMVLQRNCPPVPFCRA